jgi:hypothetical protein
VRAPILQIVLRHRLQREDLPGLGLKPGTKLP